MQFNFQGKTILVEKSGNKYNIDKLLYISGAIVEAWNKLSDRLGDGKFGWVDVLRTGLDIKEIGFDVAENFEEIKNEITDLSQDELNELARFLMGAFGLSHTEAHNVITNIVLASLNVVYNFVSIYRHAQHLPKK
ncbi:unnamed protein product [marine sediment metagenome]|jgi:hypothetical protein|uniref:Uncharacterized protein n=1 Tax=marine sediment metagenome TaxID=412755 RepID=X0SME3_9ZZZZ